MFYNILCTILIYIFKLLLSVLAAIVTLYFVMLKGPCTGNQQSLAHSRLWDAVVGFLHVFAHMQMKLSQVR